MARLSWAGDEAASIPIQRTSRATPSEAKRVRVSLVTPILVLFLLGTLDVFLTLVGLGEGGHEFNPIARVALAHGFAVFVTARIFVLSACSLALLALAPATPRLARASVWAIIAVYSFVNTVSLTQLVLS